MSKKKRIMRKFTINEISAVDRPAQSGARMVIMKRANDEDTEIQKRAQLTTSVDGHAHLIWDDGEDGGHTSWVKGPKDEEGHSHPWVRTTSGEIIIGEADGHTHEIVEVLFKGVQSKKTEKKGDKDGPVAKANPADPIGGNTKESHMTDKVEKSAEDLAAENKTLQDDLAKAKAFGEFTDAEKEYYSTLDDTQKAAFITKSAEDRKAEVTKAQAEDPVVYKSLDGEEFRKSDDPRLVKLAKQADEDRKIAKAETEKRENAEFAKRASEELKHLPGEEVAKIAILKAVDGIKDEETRKGALALLKANNEAMSKAFETKGTSGSGTGNSATEKLDSLAKKYAEDNKVSFAKAYDTVIQTAEGKTLYEQSLN